MKETTFQSLSLSHELLQALGDMGFTKPSPIQEEAIPHLMNNRDLIGQAMTGTGKTAAFLVPALEKIDTSKRTTQVIVLCPTRELALQVCGEAEKLVAYKPQISTLAIYGGQAIERQTSALKRGVHLLVGTPGRVNDHLRRGTIDLSATTMLVLDEADQMLDMGFRDDIQTIISHAPASRQTVLFSATMSPEIMNLAKKFQKDPVVVKVAPPIASLQPVEQAFYAVSPRSKIALLARLLDLHNPLAIVFCNTKRKVDDVSDALKERGFAAEGIHGDMTQEKRLRVMNKFRTGSIKILVATDVAARGIDVQGIDVVFNFELPRDNESYVHRIGRTGRAGRTGLTISFASGRELFRLREIMRFTNQPIAERPIPTREQVLSSRARLFIEKATAHFDHEELDFLVKELEKHVSADVQPLRLAAALLKEQLIDVREENILASDSRDESGDGRDRAPRRRFSNDRRPSFDQRSDRSDRPSRPGGRSGGGWSSGPRRRPSGESSFKKRPA